MTIRTIATAVDLAPWLPTDYITATGWSNTEINDALAAGNDPRLIAAEIWEEYALSLPTEADGSDKTVAKWTNIDVSVEYGVSRSAREHAERQARFHRARAKVRTVRFGAPVIEGGVDDAAG